jgi:hypothetical protein
MMQPPPYGSSYDLLLVLLRQRVRDQDIEGRILVLLQNGFEKALTVESPVLARPERQRLFQTVMGEVLNKVTERINKGDHA